MRVLFFPEEASHHRLHILVQEAGRRHVRELLAGGRGWTGGSDRDRSLEETGEHSSDLKSYTGGRKKEADGYRW